MSCKKIVLIYLTVIVMLGYFVEKGVSIKCWECRSDVDPKCADPFDNSSLPITDCNYVRELDHLPGILPTMCRKIRQKVNAEWRYIRTCAFLNETGVQVNEGSCLIKNDVSNIYMESCTCNSKDGCNAAPELHHNLVLQYGGITGTIIITWFLRT